MIDWYADQSDKFIGTTAALISLAAAGVAAGGSAYAANKQSGAAQDAARLQTDAANHAADLQSKSAADTLAFQKQQAAQDLQTQNATQQANYNQWAAREQRMSNFGQMLGLAPRDIPGYQPLPGSTLPSTQTAPTTGQTASGQQPSGNLSDPNAWMSLVGNDEALKSWIASGLGTAAQKPGLVDYYAKVIKGQPGANPTEQAGSAAYYLGKLQSDPNVTGKATAAPANSMASMLTPQSSSMPSPFTVTPALQAPSLNSFQQFLSRPGA